MGKEHQILLKNVLFVPSFHQNILSVQAAVETREIVLFEQMHNGDC